MPTDIHPLVTGLAATAVAVLSVVSWASLGAFFMRGVSWDDPVLLPSAILVGSALTSASLAVAARVGLVAFGAAAVTAVGLTAIVFNGRQAGAALRDTLEAIPSDNRRRWLVGALALGLVAWVYAISPPREADAMRYHLAHLRQIITDGQWQPIADFHYAIPFAWTVNFLPFELIGLPQAAQLTNLLLLVVVAASVVRIARRDGRSRWGLLLLAIFAAHPLVIRTFTSATADGYAVFALFTSGLLLLRLDRISSIEAALLGFVAWTGSGSRYQLIVWGIVVSGLFVWSRRGRGNSAILFKRYATGAGCALVLASPYYIANLTAFGNPVWPFLVSRRAAEVFYQSAIARGYSDAMVAGVSPGAFLNQLVSMAKPSSEFPIAGAILVVCIAGLFSRRRSARALSTAVLFFALAWIPSWPVLYPRLVLPAIGVGLLIALELRGEHTDSRMPRRVVVIMIGAAVAMASATVYAGLDHFRYAVTGDTRQFHRYTWFYDLYDSVNRTTPSDSRFLVVVYSGHSYYLDRPYRRADPWLSGVVDWRRVNTGAALDSVLTAGHYDRMIYQLHDWSQFIGGREMMAAVVDAIRAGYLVPDTVFHERLYTSRVAGRYETSDVLLLRHRRQ